MYHRACPSRKDARTEASTAVVMSSRLAYDMQTLSIALVHDEVMSQLDAFEMFTYYYDVSYPLPSSLRLVQRAVRDLSYQRRSIECRAGRGVRCRSRVRKGLRITL